MKTNKTVNTILYFVLVIIEIVFILNLPISFEILIRARNTFSLIKYFLILAIDILLVIYVAKALFYLEKKGINDAGSLNFPPTTATTIPYEPPKRKTKTIDKDLGLSGERVSGIIAGREFDLLDTNGDGFISVHEYYLLTEDEVLEKIKAIDSNFSLEKFYTWVRMVYQTMMKAFSRKDIDLLRSFEDDSLFIQHKQLIEGYIRKNETRKIDKIVIKGVLLKDYKIEGDKQILVVALATNLVDYLVDSFGVVLDGISTRRVKKNYILTFVRDANVMTKRGSTHITTKCPNCGANVKLDENGLCSYCGGVVTAGKYSWVLLNIKEIIINGK